MQSHGRLEIATTGPGLVDITARVQSWLASLHPADGLLTLFLRHTSASLLIQENADPDVLADLRDALDRLAPQSAGYRHATEGQDDMPAHIKTALTAVTLSIPVIGGAPALGTWQAIYVAEHRASPHRREVLLHYVGTIQGGETKRR